MKKLLRLALKEDVGTGDKTAQFLIASHVQGRAVVVARDSGVFSGAAAARGLCRIADPGLKLEQRVKEGAFYKKGRTMLILKGRVHSILKVERVLLNLLGRLSGIATQTRKFVDKAGRVSILDTRKTTPLWRELEKKAVRAGGGVNHRMGLYDYILVKENHRPYGNLSLLKKIAGKFEIEVRNSKELRQALTLKPQAILFDNFSPQALKKVVREARKANPKIILEASGGVTLQNVGAYARTGVDRISIGSLTHSVKSANFSLLLK